MPWACQHAAERFHMAKNHYIFVIAMNIRLIITSVALCVGMLLSAQTATHPNLLLNPGFESSSSNPIFGTEFDDWTYALGAVSVETTDRVEGAQSMRFKYTATNQGTLSQDVFGYSDSPIEGATYVMRVRYKIIAAEAADSLNIDSYWNHRTDGPMDQVGDHDRDVLLVNNITGADWTTLEIETTCPQAANKFTFRLTATKGLEVLFDDFSFHQKEATSPQLLVSFQKTQPSTTVGDTVYFNDIVIDQANLTSDVVISFTGANADQFFATPTTIPAANGITHVKLGYAPTIVGQHRAMVIIETANHSALNQTISVSASASDPAVLPTISVNPQSLPLFETETGTTDTAVLVISSASCIAPIDVKVEHIEKAGFIINGSQFTQNIDVRLVVTFRPNVEGDYHSKITISTQDATPITVDLTGKASKSTAVADSLVRAFHFDWANPLALLNETFESTQHNTPVSIDGWQNVVPAGDRPWWGFEHKDAQDVIVERSAKATTFIYQHPSDTTVRGTQWLVTPVLDFDDAAGRVLTMRLMGDFMYEGHSTDFSVWLIDSLATDSVPFFSEIKGIGVPASPDLNGEWSELHVNLEGQEIAPVFAIGFKYDGVIGEANSVVYYVDDVSWGRTDLPVIHHDSAKIEMIAPLSVNTMSGAVTVSGDNLTEDIRLKVMGANPSNFKLSHDVLPATGGQFAVTFKSDKEGVHEAYVKLSSRGAADTYIPMAVLCKSGVTQVENARIGHVVTWTEQGRICILSDHAVTVDIITVSGQHVAGYTDTEITSSTLADGVYILKITDGLTVEYRKVTIF